MLSDAKMNAARSLGVAFEIQEGMLKKLKGYGIDLEKASGESHHLLPVPSIFNIGKDRKVRFSYVDPDYTKRIDPQLLLAAAKASLE